MKSSHFSARLKTKVILLLLVGLLLGKSLFASLRDELKLEAIAYDAKRPESSVAVINGEFLEKGGEVGRYKITEIGKTFVELTDPSKGKKERLEIYRDEKAGKKTKPFTLSFPKKEKQEKKKEPSLPSPWNPISVLNQAKQTQGIATLRRIYSAAQLYYSEEGKVPTLGQLVERQLLPESYLDGTEGGYRFHITPSGDGIEVRAEPENPGSGLAHFLIDAKGELHGGQDKPPDASLPPPKPESYLPQFLRKEYNQPKEGEDGR